MSKLVKIEGVVYCTYHGDVHDDTLDPYSEGEPTCFGGEYGERTKALVHRTVYYRAHKGDWENQ